MVFDFDSQLVASRPYARPIEPPPPLPTVAAHDFSWLNLAAARPEHPKQIKLIVHCASFWNPLLVVNPNISFASLTDRINAKLQRISNLRVGPGQLKLKFLDDNDYVTIQSDEDVQVAFETCLDQYTRLGELTAVELYCQY